jgi:hypothetical protein
MIAFDLRCSAAHEFEGWFGSSGDFDAQIAAGLLRCPYCEDGDIAKQLSAPNIGRKGNQSSSKQAEYAGRLTEKGAPGSVNGDVEDGRVGALNADSAASGDTAAAFNVPAKIIEKLAMVQADLLKNSRWVGRKFADEARAMHYGEAAEQQIHGESSPQEAAALAEEGIAVAALPLPVLPPNAKN